MAAGPTRTAATAAARPFEEPMIVSTRIPVTEVTPRATSVSSPCAKKLSDQLSLFDRMPVLLAVSDFSCPWARVDIRQRASLVQRLSVISDEPCFILAPESGKFILGVDTEEWEYQLIVARWSDDGDYVPWSPT